MPLFDTYLDLTILAYFRAYSLWPGLEIHKETSDYRSSVVYQASMALGLPPYDRPGPQPGGTPVANPIPLPPNEHLSPHRAVPSTSDYPDTNMGVACVQDIGSVPGAVHETAVGLLNG